VHSVPDVRDLPPQQLAVYAAATLAIALIGARYLKESAESESRAPPGGAPGLRVARGSTRVAVHVTGAVRRPGVYRLPGWARLDLAVRRAGGATRSADLAGVNLAAKVADGQQVVVPARPEGGSAVETGATGPADAPVSLNTATLEDLDELDGIGPATAQKILDWRKEHGGFSSVDELKQVSGIGPKRFEALKEKVRM
jgi:competence protein ComEA